MGNLVFTLTTIAIPPSTVAAEGTMKTLVDGMDVRGGCTEWLTTNLANLANVEITSSPSIGRMSVRPDNTLSLVLLEEKAGGSVSFSIEATFDDASTQTYNYTLNATALPLGLEDGVRQHWATGEYIYMLETDASGDLIVEPGDTHRKLYVSSVSGLNAQGVADHYNAANGTSLTSGDITTSWLLNNPEYGGSESLALDPGIGNAVWSSLSNGVNSNWLLLERGGTYATTLLRDETEGESPFHPVYIGAYGTGNKPIVSSFINYISSKQNVVLHNLECTSNMRIQGVDNFLVDSLYINGAGYQDNPMGISAPYGPKYGTTVRRCSVFDAYKSTPDNGSTWDAWNDRLQGIYVSLNGGRGLLFEENFLDHNGWEDGYDETNAASSGPQPPSPLSHNTYSPNSGDRIVRRNISMRASSWGMQFKGGGFYEDNVLIDNCGGFACWGHDWGGMNGPYDLSFGHDNLVVSAGCLTFDTGYSTAGAQSYDINTGSAENAFLNNIICHLADPNNASEYSAKEGNLSSASILDPTRAPYYDQTIVYNWDAQNFSSADRTRAADRNIGGLNTTDLDNTTIQLFTDSYLSASNSTIADLATHLRGRSVTPWTVNREILDYFQQAFDTYDTPRTTAATLAFRPSDLSDGVMWCNRVNWSMNDLPGTVSGDSVDLGNNLVTFNTISTTVQDMTIGGLGQLEVTSNRLNVDGTLSAGIGAQINVRFVGQIWINGYSSGNQINLTVTGGRFVNTGTVSGHIHAEVSSSVLPRGNTIGGQMLLGYDDASYTVGAGSTLSIVGSISKVGFDGHSGGSSSLSLAGTLAFEADANGFSTIQKFRSGINGTDAPSVTTSVTCGGTLTIDVAALGATTDTWTLIEADSITGSFGTVTVQNLPADRDATVTVGATTVTIQLAAGTGQTTVN